MPDPTVIPAILEPSRAACGCDAVMWNPYNEVTQCHRCGRVIEARAAIRDTAALDAGPGWWHPEGCIDQHDDDHNCLDAGGSIIGWRDPVTAARLSQPSSSETKP